MRCGSQRLGDVPPIGSVLSMGIMMVLTALALPPLSLCTSCVTAFSFIPPTLVHRGQQISKISKNYLFNNNYNTIRLLHSSHIDNQEEGGSDFQRESFFLPKDEVQNNNDALDLISRRNILQSFAMAGVLQFTPTIYPSVANAQDVQADNEPNLQIMQNNNQPQDPITRGQVFEIQDPNGYSGVAYIPPASATFSNQSIESLPLLVVLHGAGQNHHSALYEFTHSASATNDPPGDHINLPPYLLATQQAPASLADNFVVVAPYVGKDKRSLYDDPRGNILSFVKWFRTTWMESHIFESASSFRSPSPSQQTTQQHTIRINPQKVYLFGFSEGATLAVELATTRQFQGLVLASYGFQGKLPKLAVERLQGIPMWIFHSKGDDIYNIQCSEQLVESLIEYAGGLDVFGVGGIVKFTKLLPASGNRSSSGVNERGREHVRAALVASKSGEVYSWLMGFP